MVDSWKLKIHIFNEDNTLDSTVTTNYLNEITIRKNMTKHIRIENADTSNYNVSVEVWDKNPNGDKLVETKKIDYPTQMLDITIWSDRYLVIRENGSRD